MLTFRQFRTVSKTSRNDGSSELMQEEAALK
jgi:hypothetical protein